MRGGGRLRKDWLGLIYMWGGEGGSPVPHPAQCMMKHPGTY